MTVEPARAQLEICERVSVEPDAPSADAKLGLGPTDGLPLNGLRHRPEPGTSGWFIWAGGEIDQSDDGYFRSTHVTHLGQMHPEVMPYLALPPGWRFQVAPGQEDVWYDARLLAV